MRNRFVLKFKDLYCFTTGFWIVAYMLHQTGFDDVLPISLVIKVARVMCYLFFVLSLLRSNMVSRKVLIRAFLVLCIIIPVCAISISSSENTNLFDIIIICLSARHIYDDKIVADLAKIQLITIALTVASSIVGIIGSSSYTRSTTGTVREGLGFLYATYSANYFFHAALAYVAFRKRKFSLKFLIVLEIANFILFYYTNTYAVFIEFAIAAVVCFAVQYMKKPLKDMKVLNKLLVLVFPICAVIPFAMTLYYDSGNMVWVAINTALSHRLSIGQRALDAYPITAFGQLVSWYTGIGETSSVQQTYLYVDSSFINIAITNGAVVLCIVVLLFTLLMKKMIREDKKMVCIALLFIAMHSMSDPQLLLLQYDVVIIALVSLLEKNGEHALRA